MTKVSKVDENLYIQQGQNQQTSVQISSQSPNSVFEGKRTTANNPDGLTSSPVSDKGEQPAPASSQESVKSFSDLIAEYKKNL